MMNLINKSIAMTIKSQTNTERTTNTGYDSDYHINRYGQFSEHVTSKRMQRVGQICANRH